MQSGNNGFFPRFYKLLYEAIINSGNKAFLLQPNNKSNRNNKLPGQVLFGTRLNWFIHFKLYKYTGLQDIWSCLDTIMMIYKLEKIKPDILHFHVVNEWCINFIMLGIYTRIKKIPIIWTMHDCRAFTGRCAYFDEINCKKWITGCGKCPETRLYNPTYIDNSSLQWRIRKFIFNRLYSLNIVTPSKWLYNYVKMSFFYNKNCEVIYNGINTNIFNAIKPDDWLDKYNVRGKKIILGVAAKWEKRKGFDYFVRLSNDLPINYQIILIGLTPYQVKNIINIPQITDSNLLASIYQHSSIFCNPTLADNFPTTNIEALASGTPVITFNTGGSSEAVDDTCGIVVEKGNYSELKKSIIFMIENIHRYTYKNCIKRSLKFSRKQYDEYIKLYKKTLCK